MFGAFKGHPAAHSAAEDGKPRESQAPSPAGCPAPLSRTGRAGPAGSVRSDSHAWLPPWHGHRRGPAGRGGSRPALGCRPALSPAPASQAAITAAVEASRPAPLPAPWPRPVAKAAAWPVATRPGRRRRTARRARRWRRCGTGADPGAAWSSAGRPAGRSGGSSSPGGGRTAREGGTASLCILREAVRDGRGGRSSGRPSPAKGGSGPRGCVGPVWGGGGAGTAMSQPPPCPAVRDRLRGVFKLKLVHCGFQTAVGKLTSQATSDQTCLVFPFLGDYATRNSVFHPNLWILVF